MVEKKVVIKNKTGLHARPAGRLVKKAKAYLSDIKLIYGDKEINAKSVMNVMTLGAAKGKELIIKASGDDEKKAVNELVNFIEIELPAMEENGE
ncbi:HPr family phosphocarrier protein [Halocella sp. SP3-1]|uniref:HPr family phosphocarrier protein n=1 Tax=Halocella sp. SP3-1 TaxID=2382161 RepID=UPI0013E0178B